MYGYDILCYILTKMFCYIIIMYNVLSTNFMTILSTHTKIMLIIQILTNTSEGDGSGWFQWVNTLYTNTKFIYTYS